MEEYSKVSDLEGGTKTGPIYNFLSRVYLFLVAELAYTLCFVLLATATETSSAYILENNALLIAASIGCFVFLVLLFPFKGRRLVNLFLLWAFVTCISYLLSVACAKLQLEGKSDVLITALFTTLLAFGALSFFVLQTRIDFTFVRTALFGCFVGLGTWSLVVAIFGFQVEMLYSLAGTFIFCLYIVFDTSRLVQTRPLMDPLEASISLYLGIINLFVHLVDLLNKLRGGK